MAIPLIGAAAMAAGRAVAKKLATRAVGGITGAGAKQVTPVYRNIETGNVKIVLPSRIEAKEFSKFIGEKVSPKEYQQIQNKGATKMAKDTKSGAIAKAMAKAAEKRAK